MKHSVAIVLTIIFFLALLLYTKWKGNPNMVVEFIACSLVANLIVCIIWLTFKSLTVKAIKTPESSQYIAVMHTIEELIGENDLSKALDLLTDLISTSDSLYRKEVFLLKSRYKELRQVERSGIIPFSEISTTKTKLKSDILDLLDDMCKL